MSQYANDLVKQVRILYGTEDYGDNFGLKSSKIILMLNNSIIQHYNKLLTIRNDIFLNQEEIDVNASTDTYNVSESSAWDVSILTVQFKSGDTNSSYIRLPQTAPQLQGQGHYDYPYSYQLFNGSIKLSPFPINSGKLRVVYQKKPYVLACKVATVNSLVYSGSDIIGISVSYTTDTNKVDDNVTDSTFNTASVKYVNITSPEGILKAKNIPFTNASSSVIGLSGYTLPTGESITAGDYVSIGLNSSTHTNFPVGTGQLFYTHATELLSNISPSTFEKQNGLRRMTKDLETSILDAYEIKKDYSGIQIDDESLLIYGA